MKYRITGLVATVLALIAVFTISFMMPEDNGKRYIQHIDAREKTACSIQHDEMLCTHLPIVKIDTEGSEIPGRPIYDEKEQIIGYKCLPDGNTMLTAKLATVDNEDTYNHADDTEDLKSDIKIRIRGNSSRSFDKPNYYIKLINPDGTNNPKEFLGMDAHHEWALHGPFLDKSLIRNYMWYNLAGEIMDYAPNVRFCEVILNGEYQGLYLATETITGGKEGARISLEVNKKDSTFSGYIMRLDKGDEKNLQNITPFTKYSLRTLMQHEIIYPGQANITPELREMIKDDFSLFEKTIYSYDFDSEVYGYEELIDVDSFVDYFLINEISCNYDAGWMSTYMYKDIDNKYRMCVWDFNSACDFYQDAIMPANNLEMQNCLWYFMLIKDKAFTERIVERYWELRETVFSDEYIDTFIDETVNYLGDAVERNYKVWGYSLAPEYDMLSPPERNPGSHEEAIIQIKDFMKNRLTWMDENIDTILQYGVESKNKKFNENAN